MYTYLYKLMLTHSKTQCAQMRCVSVLMQDKYVCEWNLCAKKRNKKFIRWFLPQQKRAKNHLQPAWIWKDRIRLWHFTSGKILFYFLNLAWNNFNVGLISVSANNIINFNVSLISVPKCYFHLYKKCNYSTSLWRTGRKDLM